MELFSPERTPAILRAAQTRSGPPLRRSPVAGTPGYDRMGCRYPGSMHSFEHRFWLLGSVAAIATGQSLG